jgi:hypothetical protein
MAGLETDDRASLEWLLLLSAEHQRLAASLRQRPRATSKGDSMLERPLQEIAWLASVEGGIHQWPRGPIPFLSALRQGGQS